jgi:hypothetical protein
VARINSLKFWLEFEKVRIEVTEKCENSLGVSFGQPHGAMVYFSSGPGFAKIARPRAIVVPFGIPLGPLRPTV